MAAGVPLIRIRTPVCGKTVGNVFPRMSSGVIARVSNERFAP